MPDELATVLTREAKRSHSSISALVRSALRQYLRLSPEQERKVPFAAAGRSGHRHTARDAEKILDREWGRHQG